MVARSRFPTQLTDLNNSLIIATFKQNIEMKYTEFRIITLVEEELAAHFLNDNIPAVVGANAAHERGQDCIGSVNVSFRFGQLK